MYYRLDPNSAITSRNLLFMSDADGEDDEGDDSDGNSVGDDSDSGDGGGACRRGCPSFFIIIFCVDVRVACMCS